jgi:hypothetical protein
MPLAASKGAPGREAGKLGVTTKRAERAAQSKYRTFGPRTMRFCSLSPCRARCQACGSKRSGSRSSGSGNEVTQYPDRVEAMDEGVGENLHLFGSRKPAPVHGPTQYDLTYNRTIGMFFHMKTTLNIDDTVMAQLKREAARQNRTMSELVETALRGLFRSQRKREHLPPLPTFQSGGSVVDVADRDALYQAMEGR